MPYSFSPSSLSLLKDCPRCFWLAFNKGIKRPNGIFPSLPSGMDRILKAHFDAFRDRGELPPELSPLRGYSLFPDAALLSVWRNNRAGLQWTDREGNLLRGAVDNILQKDKKLVVLDYKTRGYPLKDDTHEHYVDQLNLYNLLLQKNGYETHDYAYLLFYHPDKVNADGTVMFHTDLLRIPSSVSDAQSLLSRAFTTLKSDEPQPAEKCAFCAFRQKRA